MRKIYNALFILLFTVGCSEKFKENTFGSDINLLQNVNGLKILKDGDAMLAVSGAYQGRIFTSSSKGLDGRSYGWFNRSKIQAGNSQNELSKLGGEGRFWFGPEIGKFSIFFEPGKEQVAENIKISPDLNNVLFQALEETDRSITYGSSMKIRNANGYVFDLYAKRHITLKTKYQIEKDLKITYQGKISSVGFSTETSIKNTGKERWTKENGLLSIWDIGCMIPSDQNIVIIPITQKLDSVTRYFSPLDSTRIRIIDNAVIYKADANYMNKIGIQPEYCTNVFGSYSPELKLLNIVTYSFESDSLYANSLWGHSQPYKGDVINVFNGMVDSSLDYNWPFYELESSSSVKELKVGEEIVHTQSIYHFEGDEADLDKIAQSVLGVSLPKVKTVF